MKKEWEVEKRKGIRRAEKKERRKESKRRRKGRKPASNIT